MRLEERYVIKDFKSAFNFLLNFILSYSKLEGLPVMFVSNSEFAELYEDLKDLFFRNGFQEWNVFKNFVLPIRKSPDRVYYLHDYSGSDIPSFSINSKNLISFVEHSVFVRKYYRRYYKFYTLTESRIFAMNVENSLVVFMPDFKRQMFSKDDFVGNLRFPTTLPSSESFSLMNWSVEAYMFGDPYALNVEPDSNKKIKERMKKKDFKVFFPSGFVYFSFLNALRDNVFIEGEIIPSKPSEMLGFYKAFEFYLNGKLKPNVWDNKIDEFVKDL